MDDHLARLCFEGGPSSGRYTPHGYDLTLHGVDEHVDHVVYLHEVHHAGLNDETAWGSALHVYMRLPAQHRPTFHALLDSCRVTHESFATYSSVRLAAARHGDVDSVLAAYPDYIGLHEGVRRLVADVDGVNRRLLAVAVLARLCMQTPVLETIVAAGRADFSLASVRDRDRPDTRWAWFVSRGPAALAESASSADAAIAARFGPQALQSDAPDGDLHVTLKAGFDEVWDMWERLAYEHLRQQLSSATGAATVDFDGHRDADAALQELVLNRYGDIGLRCHGPSPEARRRRCRQFDPATGAAQPERGRPLPGRAAAVDGRSRALLQGAALVVHVRPAGRLEALYRWQPGTVLPDGPVAAVRAFCDDGGSAHVLGHCVVADPDELGALAAGAAGRMPFAVCVSASCLVDTAWTRRWLGAARAAGPVFVLIDVEPDRIVPRWAKAGGDVLAVEVELEVDTAGGRRMALLCVPADGVACWITLGDDVTIRVMSTYLRELLGVRLRSDPEGFESVRTEAIAVLTSVLGTESFVSFDALAGRDG